MIEKRNKKDLAKGPPGLMTRKSRDSLWNMGVRGDPPLFDCSRGDPPEQLKDRIEQFAELLIFSNITDINRPDGRNMPMRVPSFKPLVSNRGFRKDNENDERCLSLSKAELPTATAKCDWNNKVKKDCVRVDYYSHDSMNETQNIGTYMSQGFHRAPCVEAGHVLSVDGLIETGVVSDGYRDNRKLKPRRLKSATTKCDWNNKVKKDCVRVDYYSHDSMNETQNIGTYVSQGFHRAPCVEAGHVLSVDGLIEAGVVPDGYRDNRNLKPRRLKSATAKCNWNNKVKKDCVRVDYYSHDSMSETQNIGTYMSQGFHRAPGVVIVNDLHFTIKN